MRILLLAHAFNSLTQRLFVELTESGHEVSVELDVSDAVTREAVELFDPDVILASFLKRAIAEDIWRHHRCLIVHPGIAGDRGPSALDWAVLAGETTWGVTVLEARAELDAGPIWASETFPMRAATKSSLYRGEVADAATRAVRCALERLASGVYQPRRPEEYEPPCRGRARPACRPADRRIDWQSDSTELVLRKIRSADGSPGVSDSMWGRPVRLFEAYPAQGVAGAPGEIVARGSGALARVTRDGAVWIGHVREERELALKLPAATVFAAEAAALPLTSGFERVRYEEEDGVGLLSFEFYNGALGPAECRELRERYAAALARPTRVLVLMGGRDYWSSGIHLGLIEAADSPAEASWESINAIDDLAREIIQTTDRLVISALRGGAGAGGVFLALAADEVWASRSAVLNPHYKDMGNLYGSEYWTYLLPRRVGKENAERIMQRRLPMGVAEARRLGIVDRELPPSVRECEAPILELARALARDERLAARVEAKRRRRAADEREQPLESYRARELARMHRNFYGFDPSYHVARYNFIHKVPKSRTPLPLARHRARPPRQESAHV
jgi:putative two-component system hydrogenase maturation factor HypX/HoxX